MRKTGKFPLLIIALLILGLVGAGRPAAARIVDRIVAVAGSQAVTAWALRQAVIIEFPPDKLATLPQETRKKIAKKKLDELIDNRLIAQMAAAKGIQVSDEAIDGTIKRVLEQNKMTREDLKKALAEQGLDFASYRSKIASDLLKSRYISKEIKANIIITDQEIMEYARKHDLFSQDESVTIAQIFIPKNSPNAAGGKDNEIWKTIRKRLKNEENFFALASEFSEGPAAPKGGRLGTFKRGSLLKEIEEEAYKLPLGEASDVIKTDLGYHMIVVTNRTGKDEKALTPEAEEKIKGLLYNEKLKAAVEKLGEELRRKYKVKILVKDYDRLI
jgi:parvulin-like peptidyl-prolyl isomerase